MNYRILQWLSSRKLAITLLTSLILLLLSGTLFSKVTLLGPPEIVKTWVFMLLSGFVLLSTAICSILRISRNSKPGEITPSEKPLVSIILPGRTIGENLNLVIQIKQLLSSAGWVIRSTSKSDWEAVIHGRKGDAGFWGSILFHASLLIIILGGVLSLYTGFYAGIVVTEGQSLEVTENNLVDISRLPKFATSSPGFRVELESFEPIFEQNRFFTQYLARLTFTDPIKGKISLQNVKINNPASFGWYEISLYRYGFAPLLKITDNATGQVLNDAYVNLVVLDPADSDSIILPPGYPSLHFRMFPDAQMQNRTIRNRSPLPKNPVFLVWTAEDKNQPLPLGGKIKLQKVAVQFTDLHYWANFRLSRDAGQGVIYLGFGIGILGLVLRFANPRKHLLVTLKQVDEQLEIALAGSCAYFPALFQQEITALAGKIEREITCKN
jgi:cytochrome c biogenesis protein ResB